MPARLESQARLGERLDVVGHDRRAPLAYHAEDVRVRREAEALIPRVVLRREVSEVVVGAEPLARALREHPLKEFGTPPREVIEEHADEDVLPARERVGRALGEVLG